MLPGILSQVIWNLFLSIMHPFWNNFSISPWLKQNIFGREKMLRLYEEVQCSIMPSASDSLNNLVNEKKKPQNTWMPQFKGWNPPLNSWLCRLVSLCICCYLPLPLLPLLVLLLWGFHTSTNKIAQISSEVSTLASTSPKVRALSLDRMANWATVKLAVILVICHHPCLFVLLTYYSIIIFCILAER